MTKSHEEVFGISGRIALITGGNCNIGRSIALALAGAGVKPVIMYGADEAAARAVCGEIEAQGGRAAMYQADLADVPALQPLVQRIEREQGSIDILVNNAAIRPNTKIADVTLDEWNRVFDTNLKAPFFLTQAVLPAMVSKQWGRIINIGGTDGYYGKSRRAHGVSAKMGLVGLTRAVALEMARFGITANVVVPGTIDTKRPHPAWYPELATGFAERLKRIPMGRLGRSDEVANACLFLASELASYTTGHELFVSGGAVPLVRQLPDEYPAEEYGR
ncbi:MAG TPA: SDR family oxidoreductase [Burkholderiales bacterium]|nr:SDR family oxidoreductase [Burkholderiales bacterium]